MAAWAAVAVAALVAICAGIGVFGMMRSSVATLNEGQKQIQSTLTEILKSVGALTTSAAVNLTQHEEISRRVSGAENMLGQHGEQLRVLRTKVHMVSGRLMELDPKWKPYQQEDV